MTNCEATSDATPDEPSDLREHMVECLRALLKVMEEPTTVVDPASRMVLTSYDKEKTERVVIDLTFQRRLR